MFEVELTENEIKLILKALENYRTLLTTHKYNFAINHENCKDDYNKSLGVGIVLKEALNKK